MKKKYYCIIIEDENIAIDILKNYLTNHPDIQLVSICEDIISAKNILKKKSVDLIFLDTNLPDGKGLHFLQELEKPPFTIITTSHHEYALQSYELDVVDYLMKPFSLERFNKAIEKYKTRDSLKQLMINSKKDHLIININRKHVRIEIDKIIYIESYREYINIHTIDEVFNTKMPLSKIESLLKNESFIRIHKSYIISTKYITSYSSTKIEIGKKVLPIGRIYNVTTLEKLEEKKIS